MSMDERERGTWLQVRMTDEEKLALAEIAADYDKSISAMVRLMIAFFKEERPQVGVMYSPKAHAPEREKAAPII